MKIRHLSITIFTMIIFLTFGLGQAHADNVNDVYVQNIKIQPSTVKVGNAFTVTMTLVNNSTVPVWLDGGKCSGTDIQASFFTIIFDNHAKIKAKDISCAGVGWSQILDPGKSITATSPDYTATYIATEPGTANATMTFSYHVINQTDPNQPGFSQNISKSFLFTIFDNNTRAKMPTETIPSPLKQFKSGISAQDVLCKEGLQLIIKAEDNLPACVKSKSAAVLILHGWASELSNGQIIYLMKSNSTGKLIVKYNSAQSYGPSELNAKIYNGSSMYQIQPSIIEAKVNPSIVPSNSNTTVAYTITSHDTKGIYWLALDVCGFVPIVMDLDDSKITNSDLQPAISGWKCPVSLLQYKIMGFEGIEPEYVRIEK